MPLNRPFFIINLLRTSLFTLCGLLLRTGFFYERAVNMTHQEKEALREDCALLLGTLMAIAIIVVVCGVAIVTCF